MEDNIMYNNQYQTQMNMQVPIQNNLALVKSYFRRKSVLAAGILLILLVAAEIVSIFAAVPAVKNVIDSPSLFNNYQNPAELYNAIQSAVTNASYVTTFISLAVSALFIAAFLIIYFKSKNPLPTANPRAGFSILHVFSIIYLVLICFASVIVLFAMLIITFAAIFGGSSYNSSFTLNGQPYYGNPMPFIILFFVIFAAAIALLLVWSISCVRFLGSVKRTIDGPQLVVKGAKTFGVLNIVFGILSCFGAVSTLLTSSVMEPLSSLMPNAAQDFFSVSLWITFICSAISAAFTILIGVICTGYDKFMKETIASATPVAPAAFHAPYQGGTVVPPAGNPYAGNQANPFQQRPSNPYAQGSPFPSAQQAKPEEPAQKGTAGTDTVPASEETASTETDTPKGDSLCPGCGKEVRQDDAFCEHCGYKLK